MNPPRTSYVFSFDSFSLIPLPAFARAVVRGAVEMVRYYWGERGPVERIANYFLLVFHRPIMSVQFPVVPQKTP